MDILTHTISGLAAGTVVAAFSRKSIPKKLGIVAAAGIGGALPDVDAVSLWSGFDSTIGSFFNLSYSGQYIYSAKLWYSHHGFFHSLFAALMLAAIIGATGYLISVKFKRPTLKGMARSFGRQKFILAGFVCGYLMHLLGDLPTPASAWGGIRFFWPSEAYIGGTGQIWWWNNYDIFLIASGVFLVNAILILAGRLFRFDSARIVAAVFAAGLTLSVMQIDARDNCFSYSGHTGRYQEFETLSKEQQETILGRRLYGAMERLDRALPVHF